MAVKIVTDSTSDLTPEIATEMGITVVPLNVHFTTETGTETFRDGIDLKAEDFYRKLQQNKVLPTTSAPAPGVFAEVYDKLAREADEILVITISSKLSATYKAAVDGKTIMKSKARLEVIDALSAMVGLGLSAVAAAKKAKTGATLDEVINVVRASMNRVDLRLAFDTLEYLRKGGRIGTAQAFLGSALKVNPILTLKNGLTEGVTRARCRAKAIEYLGDFVMSFNDVEEIAIEDGTTPDDAEILAERIGSKLPRERIHWMKVGPVIGTHVGPHVLGVGVLPAR
jgi:DegV family protein with EDD domain